jgi:hypothetical protein
LKDLDHYYRYPALPQPAVLGLEESLLHAQAFEVLPILLKIGLEVYFPYDFRHFFAGFGFQNFQRGKLLFGHWTGRFAWDEMGHTSFVEILFWLDVEPFAGIDALGGLDLPGEILDYFVLLNLKLPW